MTTLEWAFAAVAAVLALVTVVLVVRGSSRAVVGVPVLIAFLLTPVLVLVRATSGDLGSAVSVSELLSLRSRALALAGALVLVGGVAFLLAAPRRRTRTSPTPGAARSAVRVRSYFLSSLALAVVGAGNVALGAWLLAAARSDWFLAAAWASLREPAGVRAAVLIAALEGRGAVRPLELGLPAAVLAIALVGAVVLRGSWRSAAAASGVVLAGLACAAPLRALTVDRVQEELVKARFTPGTQLVELHGYAVDAQVRVVLDEGLSIGGGPLAPVDKANIDRLFSEASFLTGLGLTSRTSAADLERVLRGLAERGPTELPLVGAVRTPPPPGLDVPAALEGALVTERAVRLRLSTQSFWLPVEPSATVDEAGVQFTEETWPLSSSSAGVDHEKLRGVVLVAGREVEPSLLVRACHAAAQHGMRLELVFPDPPPHKPDLRSAAQGASDRTDVHGEVRLQAPEVGFAAVDRQKLVGFVGARKAALRACYERELKRDPSLQGRVVVRFTITTRGDASDIDIEENTVGTDAVAACLRSVVRGWRLPFQPRDDVPVVFPFVFARTP